MSRVVAYVRKRLVSIGFYLVSWSERGISKRSNVPVMLAVWMVVELAMVVAAKYERNNEWGKVT